MTRHGQRGIAARANHLNDIAFALALAVVLTPALGFVLLLVD
jgi:hypothetical protein